MELQKYFLKVVKHLKSITENHDVLIRGSGHSFLIRMASLGIGFSLHILLARILGLDEFGVYMYVLAWVNLLSLVGKSGFDQAAKKFIPAYQYHKKNVELYNFFRYSVLKVLGVSVLLSAGIILVSIYLKPEISHSLFFTLLGGAVLLVIHTQLSLIGSFLEAFKKIIAGLFSGNILRPLLIIAGILLLALFNSATATHAMLVNVIATGSSLLFILYFFSKSIPSETGAYTIDKTWLQTAFPLLFTSGIHVLLTQTDILLIGYFMDTEDVGIYSSVSKISQLVLFGLTAVNTITAPLISELYAGNKLDKLQEMVSLSSLLTIFLTLPVIIVIAFFTPFILNIYGAEFIEGSAALRIILIGQVINALCGSVSFMMTMTKYHKQSLYILTFAAVLNIALNMILIPLFGIEGAAATTAISTIFWNVAMYIFIIKRLKIDSTFLGFFKK